MSESRGRGRPRRHTPEAVLVAAEVILRRSGAANISMRAISEELGLGTMTLYTSFATKQEMLRALAARLLGRYDLEPDRSLPLAERVAAWMIRCHAAIEDALLFELIAAGAPITTLIDVAGAWTQQLVDEGFPPEVAVQRVQYLLWAVLGFFSVATHTRAVDPETLRPDAAVVEPEHRSGANAYLDHMARQGFDDLFALTVEATVGVVASPPPKA